MRPVQPASLLKIPALAVISVVFFFNYVSTARAGYRVEHLHTFLNPSTLQSRDRDNFSVGLDLKGDTVFIGARRDDTGASDAGVLHQFSYPSGDLVRTIENPDPGAEDRFGHGLTIVGDTVWVGSLYDDTKATDAGAVYIFDVQTGDLLQTLYSPNPTEDGVFGVPILEADGDVLIAAHGDRAGIAPGGAVYRYDAVTRDLLATYLNPTPAEQDYFGWGVDYANGEILVNARSDDTVGTDAGTAYLINLEGELLQTYPNPFPNPNDGYVSCAILGDLVAVGAIDDDTRAEDSGAVYLFSKESGQHLRTLYHPRSQIGARFGTLETIGDDLYVGAPTSNGALYPGSAFIFDPRTGNLLHEFENPIPAIRDFYGQIMAKDEDQVLIGAWGKSPTGLLSGAAHLYSVTKDSVECDSGYYLLDSFGARHRVGNPPVITGPVYFGFDIARDLERAMCSGIGGDKNDLVVLDGLGAVHFVENSGCDVIQNFYFGNFSLEDFPKGRAVDLNMSADSQGFWVLTDYGEIYRAGSALGGASSAEVGTGKMGVLGFNVPTMRTFETASLPVEGATLRAVSLVVIDGDRNNEADGYIVLDSMGGRHQFESDGSPVVAGSRASAPHNDPDRLLDPTSYVWPFFLGLDIARDMEPVESQEGVVILDGWGGIHPVPVDIEDNAVYFGNNRVSNADPTPRQMVGLPYLVHGFDDPTTGMDEGNALVVGLDASSIFTDLEFTRCAGGLYTLDKFGGVFALGEARLDPMNVTAPFENSPYFYPFLYAEDMEVFAAEETEYVRYGIGLPIERFNVPAGNLHDGAKVRWR